MERLAQAIKLAAKYREESFDKKASDAASAVLPGIPLDRTHFFKLSLLDAADKAAEEVGFDEQGTLPVYLLLACSWNEALAWAESLTAKPQKQEDSMSIDAVYGIQRP